MTDAVVQYNNPLLSRTCIYCTLKLSNGVVATSRSLHLLTVDVDCFLLPLPDRRMFSSNCHSEPLSASPQDPSKTNPLDIETHRQDTIETSTSSPTDTCTEADANSEAVQSVTIDQTKKRLRERGPSTNDPPSPKLRKAEHQNLNRMRTPSLNTSSAAAAANAPPAITRRCYFAGRAL